MVSINFQLSPSGLSGEAAHPPTRASAATSVAEGVEDKHSWFRLCGSNFQLYQRILTLAVQCRMVST